MLSALISFRKDERAVLRYNALRHHIVCRILVKLQNVLSTVLPNFMGHLQKEKGNTRQSRLKCNHLAACLQYDQISRISAVRFLCRFVFLPRPDLRNQSGSPSEKPPNAQTASFVAAKYCDSHYSTYYVLRQPMFRGRNTRDSLMSVVH